MFEILGYVDFPPDGHLRYVDLSDSPWIADPFMWLPASWNWRHFYGPWHFPNDPLPMTGRWKRTES